MAYGDTHPLTEFETAGDWSRGCAGYEVFRESGGGRQFLGMSSAIRSAGWVHTRMSTSFSYAQGSTPANLHDSIRL